MCSAHTHTHRTMFTLINVMILLHCFRECLLENLSAITNTDLQCLNELPLHQLLKIKKSLQTMSDMVNDGGNSNTTTITTTSSYSDRIGKANAIDLSDGYLYDAVVVNDSANALPLMGDQIKYMFDVMLTGNCAKCGSKHRKIFI